MKNDFSVDTSKYVKKDFLKKVQIPLGIALFLAGFETVAGIWFFAKGVIVSVWNEMSAYELGVRGLHYLSIVCIFVSLIKMIYDAKPFSHTLTICIRIISGLYFLASALFPRLPGFETNYAIGQFNGFTLIDANFLIRALFLCVFSVIIHAGFSMQKDIEETL